MSKSLGNYIGVNEPANIMFKKVMEIPDALIIKYFELATDVHPDEIDRIKKDLDKGKNPRDIKFELAKIITALYHSELEVKEAIEFYDLAFRKKDIPDNIPEIESESNILMDLIPLLVQNNIISSKSEFKRLIVQGGVRVNQEKLNDMDFKLSNNDVIKIGKKKFIRVKIK